MKHRLLALLLFCATAFAPAAFAAALPDTPMSSEPEPFQVSQKTEIPNLTLAPGSYSIRILDHLRDRVILQVSSRGSKVTTFLAVPASTMANAPVGPIPYSTGPKGKAALKGFAFPGGLAVEFVYPKNDAVSIAQANDTRVMAIDPASEGRVPAANLKQNDMEMITLWMLEPARVGPDEKPSIAATRYVAPPQAAPAPVQTAVNHPSAVTPQPARRQRPVQLAQNDVPSPPPTHAYTRPAAVKALPHTASNLPLLELGALLSLSLGGFLTLRRSAGR